MTRRALIIATSIPFLVPGLALAADAGTTVDEAQIETLPTLPRTLDSFITLTPATQRGCPGEFSVEAQFSDAAPGGSGA